MRPDQLARLAALSEKLADVMLEEADPDLWPGAGKPMDEWTKDERGNRVWIKKNANATMTLLLRVEQLRVVDEGRPPGGGDDPDEEERRMIDRAERAARDLMERTRKSAAAR